MFDRIEGHSVSRAVVTGAGGAIGSAICRGLASRGHDIVAVDVDRAGLATLAATSPARITRTPAI
ncbi:SDR family NAD(P)-dependent oxidoreductase [Prescottella defluvii]|nr:SDR family NAD(P)-dependent oxidoreductase [Prescottella defluvii]